MFARNFTPLRSAALWLAVTAAAAATGCGGSATTVTGKVSHKGKPVVTGTVILVDGAGQYHQGTITPTGTYTVADVPVGKVKIAVTSPNPDPKAAAVAAGGGKGAVGRGGGSMAGGVTLEDPRAKFASTPEPTPQLPPGAWFPLPKTAGDPETSGLTGEVKSGSPLDIDVP